MILGVVNLTVLWLMIAITWYFGTKGLLIALCTFSVGSIMLLANAFILLGLFDKFNSLCFSADSLFAFYVILGTIQYIAFGFVVGLVLIVCVIALLGHLVLSLNPWE
jgi:hypothetical protein